MALHKCPKCELNYIREEDVYCEVCKREMKRALARGARTEEREDEIILCSECGEKPAARGGELCLACLKEKKRQVVLESAAALSDDDDEYDEDSLLEDEDEDDSDEE